MALIDFVKPLSKGTTLGLGGTCFNVGCIPKKLMHTAANINEIIHKDATPFGLVSQGTSPNNNPSLVHSWETMRENVQNHIKALILNIVCHFVKRM